MISHVIIYHANCVDGFTAAWVTQKGLRDQGVGKNHIKLISAQYGDDPPEDLYCKHVYIVDFSYPRRVLKEINTCAASLLVLDHHKTAEEALEGLDYCIFDMNESGASLAWKFFHPTQEPPQLVHYVRDRDLWLFQVIDSREVNAWLRSFPFQLEVWDGLYGRLQNIYKEDVIAQGQAILRAQQRIVDKACEKPNKVVLYSTFAFAVNSTTDGLFSEVAGKLAEETGLGAAWFVLQSGEVQWSLRVRGDSDIDCSEIAKRYGGGGHKKAAGFKIDWKKHAQIMGWD